MSESATSISNMSLARFGAKRIEDFTDNTDTDKPAIYCRLFYEQTAKSLMRSHLWRFARWRVQLSQDTNTPDFQWSYAYHLPADFLRHILVYDGSDLKEGKTYTSYELEGSRLLINESEVYIKYIRWIESPASWDPLFIDLMVLKLAQNLVIPLTQDVKLKADIDKDLERLMPKVRALDRQEAEHIGRDELKTWEDSRFSDIP
jgi:hypothetical protein